MCPGDQLSEAPARPVRLLEAGPDQPGFQHRPDELKYGWGLINLSARPAGSPHNGSSVGSATPQRAEPLPRITVVLYLLWRAIRNEGLNLELPLARHDG